jgi:hypothetical protein
MSDTSYRDICKRLGVTEAGLMVLFRLKRGDDISGGNAGERLERDGFVTELRYLGDGQWIPRKLTDRGLKVCEEARKLGY